MKVFVTGVTGFIGSYLAEALLKEGHEVAGYMRQTNRLNYPAVAKLRGKVEFHYGSLTDYSAVRQALREFRPDWIAHLGAITPVAYSFEHPHEVTETNYIGTINLAEAALKECPNLEKFIFASSMETYGFQSKREPFVETDESRPACPYAVAKVAAEKYLQYLHYAHQFPAVSFRQTNAYGRKENDYFVVEAIITQMLKNPKEINLGDSRPIRNFIFIDDLVDLYLQMFMSGPSVNGQVFNTGPDNGVSIEQLASKIGSLIGWDHKINWNTRPRRPGEIFYLNSSNQKVTASIGWEPKVGLTNGLAKTVEIWADNLGMTRSVHAFYSGELV
jgi:nucleoside-diphosphate-sugar epimerase